MAGSPGRIFTRQQSMDDIWGLDTETDPHTVDVHIGTLRTKLGESGEAIHTVRGVGYRLG